MLKKLPLNTSIIRYTNGDNNLISIKVGDKFIVRVVLEASQDISISYDNDYSF